MITKKVEKSLFDKNIDVDIYNPQLLTNDTNKGIKSKIINLLQNSERFDIAISYVVMSGLQLIQKELSRYDSYSRMLLTTEGYVTCPASLRRLLDMNLTVKVYDPQSNNYGFHLKTYMFYTEDKRNLVVGSSNISARAFGRVHEMVVDIDASKEGSIVDSYSNTFESLWNDHRSIELTETFIDRYEKEYYKNRYYLKHAQELMLDTVAIRPNYMQQQALEELSSYRKEYNRGLVIAATGSGKTYLSAFDVQVSGAKKVLFLVHNRIILNSALKSFKKVFGKEKVYIELDSTNMDEINRADFIFTTDKTAHNRLIETVNKDYFDYIIIDEAHKIGEGTLYSQLIDYFNPKFLLGITATPERTDNPDFLFNVFDFCVPYEIRLVDALNNNLICPFTYYGIHIEDEYEKCINNNDYDQYVDFIISKVREIGHYDCKLKAIAFCSNINEAKTISLLLNKKGIISKSITSQDGLDSTNAKIQEYIESLQLNTENSINVLCVVDKFNEGVDIPEVNTILMLRNTSSSIIFLQQLGRGLRLTSDHNKFVTVIDFVGNSNTNYTIAQALTGRATSDKEKLISSVNENFESTSPYINVNIEEKLIDSIIKNLATNYKAKNEMIKKFKDELTRYKYIPTLLELYTNPIFNELSTIQLLWKNFYEPFKEYYISKYDVGNDDLFLKNFFSVISEFILRGYNSNLLKEYSKVLKGTGSSNKDILKHCMYKETGNYKTAIRSSYSKNIPSLEIFILSNDVIKISNQVIDRLKLFNAYNLFLEHIELIDHMSTCYDDYILKPYTLVTKAEFLYNRGSKDLYMNAVGQYEDKINKKIFYPVTNSNIKSNFDNRILDEYTFMLHTQNITVIKDSIKDSDYTKKFYNDSLSKAREVGEKFLDKLTKRNYKIELAVKFDKARYESTSYFYFGEVSIMDIKENFNHDNTKFNYILTLKLKNKIPKHLMQYAEY